MEYQKPEGELPPYTGLGAKLLPSGIPANIIPPSGGSGYCQPKKLCRNCPSRIPGSKFQELTQRVEKLEALLDLLCSKNSIEWYLESE